MGMEQQAAGSSVGKVTRYGPSGDPNSSSDREGCWATVSNNSNAKEVYMCSWPVLWQNTARVTIMCLAVGVLAWSSIALVSSSLENNEYAGIPSGGVRPELRDAYDDTSAALKYLIAVACLVLVTEIAAMVFQIIVRCLELKEFQPVSLLFHIPDIIVGGILTVMYVAGGIAIAYYAGVWGSRPEGCDPISTEDLVVDDPCSAEFLTISCSFLCVISFVSVVVILSQVALAVSAIVKKRDNY